MRSLRELLRAGAANTAAFMLQVGRSAAEISAAIVTRFGAATQRTLDAVLNRTVRAMAAGARTDALTDLTRVIPLAEMPLNPDYVSIHGGQPRVVYTVVIHLMHELTGEERYSHLVIESATNLTRFELIQQVLREWEEIRDGRRGSERIRGQAGLQHIGMEISQIWRTS